MKKDRQQLEIKLLLGNNIHRIIGYVSDKRLKDVEANYILFNDGESYIVIGDQDSYTYHDCDSEARTIIALNNKETWESLNNSESFKDATTIA